MELKSEEMYYNSSFTTIAANDMPVDADAVDDDDANADTGDDDDDDANADAGDVPVRIGGTKVSYIRFWNRGC